MAKENDSKQITCPKCEKDIAVDSIQEGRCPECKFNIQLWLDRRQVREVEEKERKKTTPMPEKKKPGLFGFGD